MFSSLKRGFGEMFEKSAHHRIILISNNRPLFNSYFPNSTYLPSILLLTIELIIRTSPISKSHSICYTKFTLQMLNKNCECVACKGQKGID